MQTTLAGNGFITTQVLREILRELDDKLSETDLDNMIEEIDTDGSGTVDWEGKFCHKLYPQNHSKYDQFGSETDIGNFVIRIRFLIPQLKLYKHTDPTKIIHLVKVKMLGHI